MTKLKRLFGYSADVSATRA